MSLLDRVRSDFANIVLNTGDFAEVISYTPAGGSAGNITAAVIPEESRIEDRNGILAKVDEIHVSALNTAWNPVHGSSVSWDSRTWDFSRREHDRGGGFVGAYFQSLSLVQLGPVSVSPV